MRYYLIDYENVQPKNVEHLDSKDQVIVFIGAKQKSISNELVFSLHKKGKSCRYFKVKTSGRNSLDFHVAYVMGELTQLDPKAEFVVISKDMGYDPLITHINNEKEIPCCRREEL